MDRRQFLLGTAAASTAGLFLPSALHAASLPVDRRFLLIFANGGWDTTRVFASEFDNHAVDMEPRAEPYTVGNLSIVDHPGRPSVRDFFQRHHKDAAILNGMLVPSVAHETCTQMVMTGGTRGTPDWAALLAGVEADQFVLPNLVMDAPSYPSQFGLAVARSGLEGQLDGLVNGSRLEQSDQRLRLPSQDVQGAVDRYLSRRSAGALTAARSDAERQVLSMFAEANRRALDLKDARYATAFGASADLAGKLGVAVEALSTGLSRTVSLAYPGYSAGSFDSHSNNDAVQSPLWEGLFAGLLGLVDRLAATNGPEGRPLSEDVTVVVVSEMGRTPALNGAAGKDHWPYTSALLFGAGIRGDRQVGGFDKGFEGQGVDLGSGDVAGSGVVPTASHLGATLLATAGLDPAEWVPGYGPIGAFLA